MVEAVLSTAGLPRLPAGDEPAFPALPGAPVEIDGRTVYLRRGPDGPPGRDRAVFVHGLGGASTNWTDLIHLVAPVLDCEAPDLPGFGRSDPPARSDYRPEAHARAVLAVLERRSGGPAHLVGNSLGGVVALLVAAARPDLVRTLTLLSPALPSLRPSRRSDPRLPLLLLPGVSELTLRRLAGLTPEERVRSTVAYGYADPTRARPERLSEAAAEVRRRSALPWADDALVRSLRGLVTSYLAPGRRSLWRSAADLRVPTLLVWGREDRLVDVSLAARAARVIPDARLLVLDGVGHVPQLEAPEAVARALLGVVEGAVGG